MALRKQWSDAKDLSVHAFKDETKGQNKDGKPVTRDDILNGNIPAYPLKFKEDLGPTLDKYEAAVKKKDPKKGQLITDSKKIITSYRTQINNAHLPPKTAHVLTQALHDIEGKLV